MNDCKIFLIWTDCLSQEAALSAEMTAKEGLRIAMEKKERQFKNEIEALEFQVYSVAYTQQYQL